MRSLVDLMTGRIVNQTVKTRTAVMNIVSHVPKSLESKTRTCSTSLCVFCVYLTVNVCCDGRGWQFQVNYLHMRAKQH